MTDENILNDLELINKTFSKLREPAKEFVKDLEEVKDVLIKLELELNTCINSIAIGIKSSKKLLNNYPYIVPVATIEVANKEKNLIMDKIFNVGIILSKLNAHDKYKEVYDELDNKEPSTDDETMQTKGLNNNLDKGEANE